MVISINSYSMSGLKIHNDYVLFLTDTWRDSYLYMVAGLITG